MVQSKKESYWWSLLPVLGGTTYFLNIKIYRIVEDGEETDSGGEESKADDVEIFIFSPFGECECTDCGARDGDECYGQDLHAGASGGWEADGLEIEGEEEKYPVVE